jgi:serine/threonine protein kinase
MAGDLGGCGTPWNTAQRLFSTQVTDLGSTDTLLESSTMIGKTIGKYRVVGRLGRGGMGTVYKAVDETLDREVAIKVLNPELTDTRIMRRFRAEATTLAKLNHPDIATIYEFFRSENDLLLVMEFVRGETLEHICVRLAALPAESAASLVDKVLSALEHAHLASIVHCDIKPANVMVTKQGGVKIMDFGTARMRGAQQGTVDGYMMGTPAYMSPEQVLGLELDGRADLYAVGVVLYRLLTAKLPFEAETPMAVVQKQISEAPTPLHVHRADLPDWCDSILQRALAKSPSERFQTADEFRDALRKATGTVSMETTNAFAISIEDVETTAPSPRATLNPLGPTPVLTATLPTLVLADPSRPGSTTRSARAANARILLLKSHRGWLAGSLLAILAVGIGGRAIVARWRPQVAPVATVSSPRTALVEAAALSLAAPVEFSARALVGAGNRQRETKCRVVLADGRVSIKADDTHGLLHEVPYDQVLSISYTQGFDPLWTGGPTGLRPVLRKTGGILGALGILVARHWVSLRTTDGKNTKAEFIVLRFDNEAQARRAMTALEKRTGLTAERVPGQQH